MGGWEEGGLMDGLKGGGWDEWLLGEEGWRLERGWKEKERACE